MKVLVLANFGMGLYKFRKELLEALVRDKHYVIVSFPEDEYVKIIEDIGCQFENTEVDRRGKNPLKDLKLLWNYYKLIKKYKPDVILTYTIKPNIYGGLISSIFNSRYFPNITGSGNAIEGGGITSYLTVKMYKHALKQAEKVFFQNKSNRDYFEKNKLVDREQPILIPGSGVNINQYNYLEYPAPDDKVRFLYIGRILKSKGIEELLIAIKFIKEKYNNVEFDVVGFCEERYEDILNEYHNQKLLTFHGQQTDIIPFIKDCNAIVQPSYHEGMSNVLLESAASGRPILASDIPGCRETFDEGVSGLGFEARNATSLINTLERFITLSHPDKVAMGRKGREKIKKDFNRDIIVNAYTREINNGG